MVTYIRSDLDFILDQIKIAEAHSAGTPLTTLIPTYNLAWGLRTVDGTYNNLLPGRSESGASDNPFNERLTPVYRPAEVVDMNGPAPGGLTAPNYNPSNNPGSIVVDSSLRTISNLIVDQTLANPAAILLALQRNGVAGDLMSIATTIKATYTPLVPLFKDVSDAQDASAEATAALAANPGDPGLVAAAAAAAAALATAEADLAAARGPLDVLLTANGIVMDGDNVALPAVAPDEGLSAPFNSWFTLFGQFFDHGLDLVGKGGSGTVFIPLQPDDPLYDPTSPTNFMVLTRATVTAGPDNVMGTADDVRPINTTTSFVDQNQTYTSHASHQVFVRQYMLNGAGDPVATGKLIEGGNGGMATWADVKEQARIMLGIQLVDSDVGNVPLLATDAYGEFIRGPNGYPQLVMAGPPMTLVEGNPAANGGLGVLTTGAVKTGHAFLADIAHNAVPGGLADGDIEIGLSNPGNLPGVYDNELLDAHYIAGDGRVNENIGLTAVHHVFHSEHNRLVDHTKAVVLETTDLAFLNEWLLVDVGALPTTPGQIASLVWDGERLFQAAKFGTEMQYQHLVFEEFARKIQPNINVFLVPDGYDATIDPNIVAEFAHVVYRFGHSMLTETIDRFDPTFTADHISLIEGFLNPLQFENNGTNATVDAEISAGAIIRGMTRQVGNHIDEFVTSALRNNLLGLPLDLATINLARGRDTGVPSLNAARREFYDVTNHAEELKPYTSWVDFAGNLKNEASIINFIAAYGTHDLITGETTIEGKRDAALTIITGQSVGGLLVPADAVDFLNGTGAYSGDLGGLENVDLWIGGLAEKTMPFGGMLGSTFNFVFEVQMESLQNGDRFYYLQRLDGLHLFGEMEGNSFAAMIMRNTDATHLPSDVFSTPGFILEVDQANQYNDVDGDGTLENTDPTGTGILTQLVIRNDPSTATALDTHYLRYTGGDHVVMGGNNSANTIIAGIGDDTIYGDGGNDRLEGGYGNDIINGGDGNDIITDIGGDENIKAGDGNDVVHAGPGLDLVLAGRGNDFVVLGTDMGSEVFGGEGDDFILGNKNAERILGNEGSDWIETGTFDGAPGDNFDEIFARDGIEGHDVFLGDGGFDEFIGEGGNDIMVGSLGRGKMAGMSGFDWVTYKDNGQGVNADLSIPIIFDEAPTLPPNASLDEFESMEGLSGSAFNDILTGSNEDALTRLPTLQGGSTGFQGSALNAQGIALIQGLQAVLGTGVTSYSAGDIILGGDGNDVIKGQAGDDIIDGDKWLNVRIGVYTNNDGTGPLIKAVSSMTELMTEMFSGAINPGQLKILRTIETANGAGDVDTAVFSDIFSNYTITLNTNGTTSVAHTIISDGLESDGIDRVRNIEKLQFADFTIDITQNSTGQPVLSDPTPTEGVLLTANTAGIADPNGIPPGAFTYQWQQSADGLLWSDIGGATAATFMPTDLPGQTFGPYAGQQLRVVVRFVDGAGNNELSVSNPSTPVGVDWDGNGAANVLNGTLGNDVADAGDGADTLNGNDGDDDLDGDGGGDTITGGPGDDIVNGDGGTDTAVFTGPVTNYSSALVGGNVVVSDNVGGDGDDTLLSIEQVRFGTQTLVLRPGTAAANGNLTGTAAADLVLGFGGNDNIDAGTGNDVVDGGAGNDIINWDANNGATDGRDVVDGGAGTDTYDIDGNGTVEAYRLYTRAAALAAGINAIGANTEIVITRNGTNNAAVIAELDNIEEINLNTAGGADTIQVFGDFTGTSLALNTITVHSGPGDDVIDISGLNSAHRIVFSSEGGNDTLIGTLRPQDVVELPFGSNVGDYAVTQGPNGQTTISNGTHSITFASTGLPEVRAAAAPPPPSGTGGDDANNIFYLGSALEDVDGGGGRDVVALQGMYTGVTLGVDSLIEVETLSLLTGSDTRFGDVGGNLYSYDLTTVDENVAAGAQLIVNASSLLAGENLVFNGSAETDGKLFIYAGQGIDTLTGGAGNDVFFFGEDGRFGTGDTANGGAGNDIAVLRGNYNVVFAANTFTDIETMTMNTASDTRFAVGGANYSYNVTTHDNNIAAGRTMTFNGALLSATETVTFDASAETDGRVRLFTGAANDSVKGGAGSDYIYTGAGDDMIAQSSGGGRDTVLAGDGDDTYDLMGLAGAETFTIYSRDEAMNAVADLVIGSNTEVVIMSNGAVIAELDDVEHIRVNGLDVSALSGGSAGDDLVQLVGDFNSTSLAWGTSAGDFLI